ncbi:hypothetical protein [Bacillus cereus]|uniref:hypothetical protein n=1 Tax=Bacillus sp. GMa5/1 TaxID=3418496 RepID=UPI002DB8CE79|nr:hypothetical protein [Bacillus cereus]MEB9437087.1 hypothetical protein [Bacillus cereus]
MMDWYKRITQYKMNGLRYGLKTSGNNYSSRQAPSILLKSTSGEPHAIIFVLQRARRRNEGFSTGIIYEFNISYKEMIEVDVDFKVAKKVM